MEFRDKRLATDSLVNFKHNQLCFAWLSARWKCQLKLTQKGRDVIVCTAYKMTNVLTVLGWILPFLVVFSPFCGAFCVYSLVAFIIEIYMGKKIGEKSSKR